MLYVDTLLQLGGKNTAHPEGFRENPRREYGRLPRYQGRRAEGFAVVNEEKEKASSYPRKTVQYSKTFNRERNERTVQIYGNNLYCRVCLGKDFSIESCTFAANPAKLAQIREANYQQRPKKQYGNGNRTGYQGGYQAPYNGKNQYEGWQGRTQPFIRNSQQVQHSFATQGNRRKPRQFSPTVPGKKAPNA